MLRQTSDRTARIVPPGVRLSRASFRRDPADLARRLLGQSLVRILDDGERLSGIIVETEAYLGVEDRACHSFGGRRTPRVEAMYAEAGTAYVYFTYGMHHCFNVVCGEREEPVAVLIRALEPVEGTERMKRVSLSARGGRFPSPRELCSGPARLCRAMGIDRALNAIDLSASDRLWIERGRRVPDPRISAGPRIGVGYAGDWAAKPLRFWVEGSEHVSR